MQKGTKTILSSIMTAIVVVFVLITLPYKQINNSIITFFDNVEDFINNIGNDGSFEDNSSFDHHIKNITFSSDNNEYYAYLSFIAIKPNDVTHIIINDKTFFSEDFTILNKQLSINISTLIGESEITPIKITKVFTKNNKEYITTLSTVFHKKVNYQLIEQRKQSVVGIRAQNNPRKRSSVWGSGVILSKKAVTKSNWISEYTMYEYVVVTNYHVIENNNVFHLYNDDENDEYPKSTKLYMPGESFVLLDYYKDNLDLAFLLLTTYDDSLVPLDDEQLINSEYKPVKSLDTVFLIGSPFIGNKPAFNSYKIGIIKDISARITLANTTICANGCESIKSSTFLGEGSSGGGLFDLDGNLIGINFAGSENQEEAFAIPMKFVIESYNNLLLYKEERSLATSSFFRQLHSQLQQFSL